MIRFFLISVVLLIGLTSISQNTIDSSFIYSPAQKSTDTAGEVVLIQDYKIESLLEKKLAVNEARPAQFGYRIQIISVTGANSRDKVNVEKAKILRDYKDVRVYVVYNAPYFKVRLGDFRTKLNAVQFLNTISDKYPQAFVVKDKVNIPYIIENSDSEEIIQLED